MNIFILLSIILLIVAVILRILRLDEYPIQSDAEDMMLHRIDKEDKVVDDFIYTDLNNE